MALKAPKAILFDWNNTLAKSSGEIARIGSVYDVENGANLSYAVSGAKFLLDFLHNQSMYIALVSNEHGDNLRKEVQKMNWTKYFNKIVGAGDAEDNKPSVAPIKLALKGSGIELGQEVWFVGDSATDIECAHNSQLISVLYGSKVFFDSMVYKPHLCITDHLKMVDILEDILKFK